MIYGSACSGIEAASAAWEPLGWKAAWLSEIGKFPSAVLAHRYPNTPNLGDMTRIKEDERFRANPIDLLVGGTPCQSFSVAGLRKGLADPRGNLALAFLGIADAARPRWVLWENVPGVLSSNGGRDFGSFVTALGQLGYGWAYRILDAQFVGGCPVHGGRPVPQRRRRVFVVGYLGDWRRAAAVLFERHSLRGDFKKSGKKKAGVAALTATGVGTCGADDNQAQAGHLIPAMFDPYNSAVSAKSPSLGTNCGMSTGRNIAITKPFIFESRFARNGRGAPEEVCPPLKAQSGETGKGDSSPIVAFHVTQDPITGNVSPAVSGGSPAGCCTVGVHQAGAAVRRLMPVECERLQGFPDGWTKVPWRGKMAEDCPDGPRYKAIGNSMAVSAMAWLGRRIQSVDRI